MKIRVIRSDGAWVAMYDIRPDFLRCDENILAAIGGLVVSYPPPETVRYEIYAGDGWNEFDGDDLAVILDYAAGIEAVEKARRILESFCPGLRQSQGEAGQNG